MAKNTDGSFEVAYRIVTEAAVDIVAALTREEMTVEGATSLAAITLITKGTSMMARLHAQLGNERSSLAYERSSLAYVKAWIDEVYLVEEAAATLSAPSSERRR